MKLSLTIPAIKSIDAPGYYWDDKTPGFCLKVTSNRGKLRKMFILQRKQAGRTITVELGLFGSKESTLDKARADAGEYTAQIRRGIDPNAEKRQRIEAQREHEILLEREREAKALTLSKALSDYVAGKGEKLAGSSSKTYNYTIQKHLKDWLNMSLQEITREMVLERYNEVCRQSVGSANNAFRGLRAIYNRNIKLHNSKVLSENPVKVLSDLQQWNEVKPRDKILPEIMFKAFWSALDNLESQDFADYFRLLFLTGMRSDEAFGMRWENIDFDKQYWTVTDTKNGRDHSLPMTRMVREILLRRKQSVNSPWVFPGKSADGNMGDSEHQQKLIRQAISFPDFNAHMLRKTMSTKAAETVGPYLVERFVNHFNKSNVTSSHYIFMELESLRGPLQSVEDKLLGLCLLNKSARSRKVI